MKITAKIAVCYWAIGVVASFLLLAFCAVGNAADHGMPWAQLFFVWGLIVVAGTIIGIAWLVIQKETAKEEAKKK